MTGPDLVIVVDSGNGWIKDEVIKHILGIMRHLLTRNNNRAEEADYNEYIFTNFHFT